MNISIWLLRNLSMDEQKKDLTQNNNENTAGNTDEKMALDRTPGNAEEKIAQEKAAGNECEKLRSC